MPPIPPGNGNPADYPTPAGYPPGIGQVVVAWGWFMDLVNEVIPSAVSELSNLTNI